MIRSYTILKQCHIIKSPNGQHFCQTCLEEINIASPEPPTCGLRQAIFPEHSPDQQLAASHYDPNNYYNDPKDVAKMVAHFLLLHDECTRSEIKAGDNIADLGLDDFSKIDLLYMMGLELGLALDVSEIEKMRTVNDVVDHFAKSSWIH